MHGEATPGNPASVLGKAIGRHGWPAPILSDNGRQFTSNARPLDHSEPVAFGKALIRHHIKHIHSRVRHPQTNGRLEKFRDMFERKAIHFQSVDEFMHRYNHTRPHGALNLDGMETPADACCAKKVTNEVLADPAMLWRNSS